MGGKRDLLAAWICISLMTGEAQLLSSLTTSSPGKLARLSSGCCQVGALWSLSSLPPAPYTTHQVGAPGLSHFTPRLSPDELPTLAPSCSQVPPGVERFSCLPPSSALPPSHLPSSTSTCHLLGICPRSVPSSPCLCLSSGLVESLSVTAPPSSSLAPRGFAEMLIRSSGSLA